MSEQKKLNKELNHLFKIKSKLESQPLNGNIKRHIKNVTEQIDKIHNNYKFDISTKYNIEALLRIDNKQILTMNSNIEITNDINSIINYILKIIYL